MTGITWKIKIFLLISCLLVTLARAQDEHVDDHSEDQPGQPEAKEELHDPEVQDEPTQPEVQDETTQPEVQDEPTQPAVEENPTEPEVQEEPTQPPVEEEHPEPAPKSQDDELDVQIKDDHADEQVQHPTTPVPRPPRRGILGMLKELVKNVLKRAIGLQNYAEHDLDTNLTEQANYMLQGMAGYKFMNNDSLNEPTNCGEGFENFAVLKSIADKTMKDCIENAKTKHFEYALQDLRDFIQEHAKLSNLLDHVELECRITPATSSASKCANLIEEAENAEEAYSYVKENIDLARKRVEFESKVCFKKESLNIEKNADKVQHYFATCQNEKQKPAQSSDNEGNPDPELVTVSQKLIRLKDTVLGVLDEFIHRKGLDPEAEFNKTIEDNLQKNLGVRYEKAQQYIEGAKRQGLDVNDCVSKNDQMYKNITRVANRLLYACSKDSVDALYSGTYKDYDETILKCKNILAVLNRLLEVCEYPGSKQAYSNCGESELPGLLTLVRDVHQRYWDAQNEQSHYMSSGQKAMDECLQDRLPLIKWEASNMESDAWQCVHVVYSLDQGQSA